MSSSLRIRDEVVVGRVAYETDQDMAGCIVQRDMVDFVAFVAIWDRIDIRTQD